MKRRSFLLLPAFLVAKPDAKAGAWGHQSFENDDALDWVESVLKREGQAGLEKTITRIAKSRGQLEAPEGCRAIAACEVLAAAQGKPSPDLPKEIAGLAKKLSPKPGDALRKAARDALERVLGQESELRSLWKDAGADFDRWTKSVHDLRSRI